MKTLTYTIDINASKAKVWDIMLADDTFREWTSAFHPGSYYEGSWDIGSPIRFLAKDDGQISGMSSKIVDNKQHEYISIEHVGEIVDGQEDTTSENALQWIGGHENYTYSEVDGVTTLKVDLEAVKDIDEELAEMFDEMWPPALDKLKQICERA